MYYGTPLLRASSAPSSTVQIRGDEVTLSRGGS